jgi:hypothetical protein
MTFDLTCCPPDTDREAPPKQTTHWSYYDAPTHALCGARITEKQFGNPPTCEYCRRALLAMIDEAV